jgi:hypothetical protein
MSGRGPAPKPQRRRANDPVRGEWQPSPGVGWQHGAVPKPPDGLLMASKVAWETWMRAWFAAHWTPDDLPGLRKVVQLYDATERGELHRSAELRMSMDNYGITPKGQQDRRWQRPKPEDVPVVDAAPVSGKYARLKAVG